VGILRNGAFGRCLGQEGSVETKADTLKQLRPIGKGDQELEKRLDQKELTQKVTPTHRKSM
jgi:hypothetical protein